MEKEEIVNKKIVVNLHRFIFKGCDILDIAILVSVIIIVIKFWNWFLGNWF